MSEADGGDLQVAICALPGVRAARVVSGADGRITEVHVVADEGKSAKQVVRDIQTVAQARFAMSIDYRVVSVVQLTRDAVTDVPVALRPVLSSVSWNVAGSRTSCRVDLSLGDHQASGEANGPSTTHGRLRLAAQAAADALAAVDGETTLDVADVMITQSAGRRIAVAVLVLLAGRTEEVLAGAALVRADDADAVVRAVLDAVNRRLTHAR